MFSPSFLLALVSHLPLIYSRLQTAAAAAAAAADYNIIETYALEAFEALTSKKRLHTRHAKTEAILDSPRLSSPPQTGPAPARRSPCRRSSPLRVRRAGGGRAHGRPAGHYPRRGSTPKRAP